MKRYPHMVQATQPQVDIDKFAKVKRNLDLSLEASAVRHRVSPVVLLPKRSVIQVLLSKMASGH
jgi:hypothetical protein